MFTLSHISRRWYEGWEGERTVLTTFPDLLIMVTVSMRGILLFRVYYCMYGISIEKEDQLRAGGYQ